jgi:hypothetical protein
MKKSRTNTIGNKGESFVQEILKWRGYTPLFKGNDSKWDLACLIPKTTTPDLKNVETFEIKTQPDFFGYRGFSVEVANKWNQYNYMFRTDIMFIQGVKCVPTGLLVTQAKTYVFTDGKYIAYFISTKALKEWFERIITNEIHRITFGGFESGSVQVQLRLDELKEIADYSVGNLPKRGRKPKVASLTSID